jgi:Mrp family chromosome partitioning ATPase
LALSLQGHSVGILDIDLTGPSIPRLVGKEEERVTMGGEGWVPVSVHEGFEMDSPSSEGSREKQVGATTSTRVGPLTTMSLGYILPSRGSAVIWRGPKKTAMIRQFISDVAWGSTDYLLVDTPPGTSDEHIALAEQLHTLTDIGPASSSTSMTSESGEATRPRLLGAVVVTTPQAISTSDVRKELNFCTKTSIPVLGVIENMAGFMCPCCGEVSNVFSMGGGEVMASECGVRFLGRVPVDTTWGEIVEGSGEEDGEEEGEGRRKERLVERYARGRLSGIFGGFVGDIL